jgi:hypothetical protein
MADHRAHGAVFHDRLGLGIEEWWTDDRSQEDDLVPVQVGVGVNLEYGFVGSSTSALRGVHRRRRA